MNAIQRVRRFSPLMLLARPLAWGAMLFTAATLAGCGYFAVMFTPEKQASTAQTPRAKEADEYFWRTLHAGKYDELTPLIPALTAAYLENPHDATIAAHLGFAHIWRLSDATGSPATRDRCVVASKPPSGHAYVATPAHLQAGAVV